MTYASNEVLSNFLTKELKYRVAKPTQLKRKSYRLKIGGGVYIVVNSKTCEVVYIGGSDNLRNRIKELKRFRMAKWKNVEGEENLFVKWFVIKNWNIEEEKLKKELNPKYDNEKHAKY